MKRALALGATLTFVLAVVVVSRCERNLAAPRRAVPQYLDSLAREADDAILLEHRDSRWSVFVVHCSAESIVDISISTPKAGHENDFHTFHLRTDSTYPVLQLASVSMAIIRAGDRREILGPLDEIPSKSVVLKATVVDADGHERELVRRVPVADLKDPGVSIGKDQRSSDQIPSLVNAFALGQVERCTS